MEHKKGWLSKSQVQLFQTCPYKWKLIYVDLLQKKTSPQQFRGTDIHKQIEEFYGKIVVVTVENKVPIIKPKEKVNTNFLKFEERRIKNCVDKNGNYDEKYFKPVYQELKVDDKEMKLRGIIDAVYINPGDDKYIIIDWKSGKYRNYEKAKYRFELALYSELFSKQFKKEVGYWGMYFIDENKLLFEKINKKYVDKMYETIKEVRESMEKGEFEPTINHYCQYCEFKENCLKHQNETTSTITKK